MSDLDILLQFLHWLLPALVFFLLLAVLPLHLFVHKVRVGLFDRTVFRPYLVVSAFFAAIWIAVQFMALYI